MSTGTIDTLRDTLAGDGRETSVAHGIVVVERAV